MILLQPSALEGSTVMLGVRAPHCPRGASGREAARWRLPWGWPALVLLQDDVLLRSFWMMEEQKVTFGEGNEGTPWLALPRQRPRRGGAFARRPLSLLCPPRAKCAPEPHPSPSPFLEPVRLANLHPTAARPCLRTRGTSETRRAPFCQREVGCRLASARACRTPDAVGPSPAPPRRWALKGGHPPTTSLPPSSARARPAETRRRGG
jgi:hypothetical protein